MKRMITILLSAGFILFFTGCVQPEFNQQNKVIVKKNGKHYKVPKITSVKTVGKSTVTLYKHIGLSNCREGDVAWVENKTNNDFIAAVDAGDREKVDSILREAVHEGKIGCSPPISI